MEYLDGVDFRAFEGMPYPELLPLMMQAAMGLKYLKRRNVLHRDLSSNNIMVILENQKRMVKILDFGVAKVLSDTTSGGESQTQTGQFLGKFSFASPELFSSLKVDWQSDVYSLGVIFHRMLTGKYPIRTERTGNYYEWVVAHQQPREFPMSSPKGLPEVPGPLKDIVRRMLARNPKDRPGSYDEIIERFDFLQRGASDAGLEPDSTTVSNLPLPVVEHALSGGSPSAPRGSGGDGFQRPPALFFESVSEPEKEPEEGAEPSATDLMDRSGNQGIPAPLPVERTTGGEPPSIRNASRSERDVEPTPGKGAGRDPARGRTVAPMRPSPGGRIVYGYLETQAPAEPDRAIGSGAQRMSQRIGSNSHRTAIVGPDGGVRGS